MLLEIPKEDFIARASDSEEFFIIMRETLMK